MLNLWKWNSWNWDGMNVDFLLWNWRNICIIDCDFLFCSRNEVLIYIGTMNLRNPNLVVDNGWVNGHDVNDNDRNDVLTIIDLIWRWKHNELMILMWQLLNEMLNFWKWNSLNGNDINIDFTLKLAKICINNCDLLFCIRNDELLRSKFDCWEWMG